MATKKILLFGDQTTQILPNIKEIYLASKRSVFLSILVERCEDALVSEISNLPFGSQDRFCNARSFLSLAEEYGHKKMYTGISTVLSCFAQIASLLVHFEKRPNAWNVVSPKDRFVVGLCTGLITGAVASTVKSIRDVLHLAPEIIRLTIRLGIAVDHRSMQLEYSRASWARTVSGIAIKDIETIIGDFQRSRELSSGKKPYISAIVDTTTVTISGPPSTLALLWEFSPRLQAAVSFELPIAAGFHGDHMSDIKVDMVLGNAAVFRRYSQSGILISSSTGKPYEDQGLENLLRSAIIDIVQKRLDWAATVQSLIRILGSSPVVLSAIDSGNASKKLLKSFEGAGIRVEHEDDSEMVEEGILSPVGCGLVAIVGISGRFPGAENLDSFWQHLIDGVDQHKKIPADRFDLDGHFDATGTLKNTTLSPYGCFIDRPGFFDTRIFNMSPREAAQTDPGQRLMLMTAYEALEMAGYTINGTPSAKSSRIGTFFGQTIDDYRDHNASQDIDMYYATGGIRAFGPGRLNYHFKWEGPSYNVDTACSSSSVAIQLACKSLLSRECDTAVAGGANILTGSDMYAGLSRGGFLSPSGACKTFDKGADGYCRADGVGTVVLKRLEDAMRDRDNVQAVIRSASTNHSAQAISITHPHKETQKKLFKKVLQDAGIELHNVDYVEMHGTGTQAGDGIEYESVSETFGSDPLRKSPLFIGTVKPNVGHSEAASGVISLIKAVMMFRKNVIPPHIGIKEERNPKLSSLEQKGLRISNQPTPFDPPKDKTRKRVILLNNFSAAGGNTSLVIEDGMQTRRSGIDSRPCHLITVSGRTAASLRKNMQQLLEWLNANDGVQLSDVAYTTTARRMHHTRRKSYVTTSIDELKSRMLHDLAKLDDPPTVSDGSLVGFVFTGQGSQYLGMAKGLLAESKFFRDTVKGLNELCLSHSWPSIMEIFTVEPATLLPIQLQVGMVCLDLSIAKLWQSWGLQPDVVMGHSLGEYAALCFAGVISASDMIYLVGQRAVLMQEKCVTNSYCMLTVHASLDEVVGTLDLLDKECEIACINGPENVVVSGKIDNIEVLHRHFEQKLINSTFLPLQYAFHSKQMDPILTGLKHFAQSVEFQKPEIPIVSTLRGEIICDRGVFGPNYLAMQTRKCVDFISAIRTYSSSHSQAKDTMWVECGPGGGCVGMIRSIIASSKGKALSSIKKNEDCWKTVTKALAELHDVGINLQWREFHKPYENSLILLNLPTYAFDLKNYWLQYKGNWSITKNRMPGNQISTMLEISPFRTCCLHRIASESTDGNGVEVVFVSDLADKEFSDMAKGHMVHGVALFPSSLYAEMAYSAASYVYSKKPKSTESPSLDLTNMEIFRPLIARADGAPQMVTLSATKSAESDIISLKFTSGDSTKPIEHAACIVRVGNREAWVSEWSQTSYLAADRIERLHELAATADAHIILRRMVYKLFTAVVTYNEKYHSLNKVFLHHDRPEAAASVIFRTPPRDDPGTYSAYWIDCLAQIGGFVLNGSPSNPVDAVYISTGWSSMRIAGKLVQDKEYRSYVYMQPTQKDGLLVGDVYFFDEKIMVGMCRGLRFQQMEVSLLKSVLGVKQSVSFPARISEPRIEQRNTNLSNDNAVDTSSMKKFTSKSITFDVIVQTIAAEVGVEVDELAADMPLEDLGIDSILTMSILPKLRNITGLELSSSLFSTHPTISTLESFFRGQVVDDPDASQKSTYSNNSADNVPSRTISNLPFRFSLQMDAILQTIANELGVDAGEIEPATEIASLGLDSLMSISVIEALRDLTGLTLSSSLFNESKCLLEICQALGSSDFGSTCKSPATPVTPAMSESKSNTLLVQATSVLLQGSTSSECSLFMLPDGSGSALSYIHLPTLSSGHTVYGLNSPYLNSPEQFELSFEAIAQLYIHEICRLQPHGTYLIAGWSIGGIYAYEVSKQLQESGRSVDLLILLDSPCPGFLPPLPAPTINVLEASGLFDGLVKKGKSVSPSTKKHFLESVKVLGNYKPERMRQTPGVVLVIWARDGVWENADNEQQERAMAAAGALGVDDAFDWLMGKRCEFGPNGWDKLVGDGDLECDVVPGNHFTIMDPQEIRAVANIISSMLERLSGARR